MEARSHRDELDRAGAIRVGRAGAPVRADHPALGRLRSKRDDGESREKNGRRSAFHEYLLPDILPSVARRNGREVQRRSVAM